MKKTYSILAIALFFLGASCSKQLNQVPISSATTATFYLQPSDFIQGINAAYTSLRGYPDRLMFLSEVRSDNIYPTNDVGRDPDPINNFAVGIAPNTYVEEAWNANFVGIFRANTVIDQIAKNPVYVGPAALATRLTAEARFLRAFYYFDLIRYYGKLPIIDHPVLSTEANTIGRSSVDSVYKFVIADLKFAIANLPLNYAGTYPSYGSTDIGRATKYAAEAILGEVYMARSGPTYGIEGPGLGVNEWALAVPLFNDIIASGFFVFNPTPYAFPVPAAGIFSYSNQSPAYTSGNREAIFDVMYLTGQTPVVGATFTWQLIPQNYFNAYPPNTGSNGALGTPSASLNLLNNYSTAPLDTRRAPTLHTTNYTFNGASDSKPFIRKYCDTTKIPTSRFDWGINFMAVRYTDILLLKAECVLNDPASGNATTDVDAVVNQVRARAGQTPIAGVTKPQLLDERRREFAGEGSRWFDLQRSGNLITIMNAWIATEDAALKKMNPVIANFIIYPVPQSQIDANPGLYTKNPGYTY